MQIEFKKGKDLLSQSCGFYCDYCDGHGDGHRCGDGCSVGGGYDCDDSHGFIAIVKVVLVMAMTFSCGCGYGSVAGPCS